MKRKNDREAREIFENISKTLPNLPAPGELPPLPIPQANDAPQEIVLPKLDELPPLPAPGELPCRRSRTITNASCTRCSSTITGNAGASENRYMWFMRRKDNCERHDLAKNELSGLLRSNQYVRPFCVWNFWIHWKSCSCTITC